MFSQDQLEDLGNYFQPNAEFGNVLPNAKDVRDKTIFFLKEDLSYVEHIMFKNAWYKKMVNSDSKVILVRV